MPAKGTPAPATVEYIVEITTSKCFDWAQGCIAETMAAVAAKLAEDAVVISREIAMEDAKDAR